MIRLNRPTWAEGSEILAWAYDGDAGPPSNADGNVWELVLLEWCADDRLYIDLAGREDCPKRLVFLGLLKSRVLRQYRRAQMTRDTRACSKRQRAVVLEAAERVQAAKLAEAKSYTRTLSQLLVAAKHRDLIELAHQLATLLKDAWFIEDAYWLSGF
jgi:hypothetical protein